MSPSRTATELQTLSDEELFELSRAAPGMFSELLGRYQEPFLRKARTILRNEEDAQDAVQEAFLRIYLKADKFSARGEGSFRSWAYAVLFNSSISLLRKRRKDEVELLPEYEEIIADPSTLALLEKKELADYVATILARIPEGLARLLSKFLLEEKSQEEIAHEEGMTVAAVKSAVFRGKRAFRAAAEEISRQESDRLLSSREESAGLDNRLISKFAS